MDANQRRELLDEVRQARNCSHPIRISGEFIELSTGEVLRRGLTVACKDRRRVLCPACSDLYQMDAFIIVASGLYGGKGTSDSVTDHPRIFATLTAPSFGPVHRINNAGSCHQRPRQLRCLHGQILRCTQRHQPVDSQLGSPLCIQCFQYDDAVTWNAHANRLWNSLVVRIRREMGATQGLSRTATRNAMRLNYFKVAEFQRRGLIHFHVIIRIDGPGGPDTPPPAWATVELLDSVARHCVRHDRTLLDDESELRWGHQLRITDVSRDQDTRRVATYLAKYSIKTTDGSTELARRFTKYGQILGLPDSHQRTLALTAWDSGYQRHAHSYGYAGNLITKSRHYSTTFSKIRGERAAYMRPQNTLETIPGTFLYDGRGYLHPRAKELAELFFSMDVELRRAAAERKRTSYMRSSELTDSGPAGTANPENPQQTRGL
jgi:hypothetical protein